MAGLNSLCSMSKKWRVDNHPPNYHPPVGTSGVRGPCLNNLTGAKKRACWNVRLEAPARASYLVDLDVAAAECAAPGVAGAQLDGKLINPFSRLCKVINVDDEVV